MRPVLRRVDRTPGTKTMAEAPRRARVLRARAAIEIHHDDAAARAAHHRYLPAPAPANGTSPLAPAGRPASAAREDSIRAGRRSRCRRLVLGGGDARVLYVDR